MPKAHRKCRPRSVGHTDSKGTASSTRARCTKWYRYHPLPGPSFIRTLLLDPADNAGLPLSGKLVNLDLSQEQRYSALSYSWATEDGDASPTKTIRIDGLEVSITRNLFEGLKRIRSRSETLSIWIDALCINQRDSAERSRQVAMMAKIYQRAEKSIVWLGEGDDADSDRRVTGILNRLLSCNNDDGKLGNSQLRAILHGSTEGWCEGERADNHESCVVLPADMLGTESLDRPLNDIIRSDRRWLEQGEASILALKAFFSKRYWSRRWVAQEFILARAHDWHWGACSMRAISLNSRHVQNVHDALLILRNLEEEWKPDMIDLRRTSKAVGLLKGMLQQREGPDQLGPNDSKIDKKFLKALRETNMMDCSDPRDKLYALLGICDRPPLFPDYQLPANEVYTAFATTLIQAGMGDVVLQQSSYQDGFETVREDELAVSLPSWVPDLRTEFVHKLQDCTAEFHGEVSRDGKTLLCHLYLIGDIDLNMSEEKVRGLNLIMHHGVPFWSEPLTLISDAYQGCRMAPRDCIFATTKIWSIPEQSCEDELPPGAILLVCRPVDGTCNTYRLVRTCLLMHEALMDLVAMNVEAEAADEVPVLVNIV